MIEDVAGVSGQSYAVGMEAIDGMFYVFLSCLGFAILYLFELVSLRGGQRLKWLVLLSGCLLIGFSSAKILVAPEKLRVPPIISWSSWPIAILFFCLLLYSNFVEIPLKKTYIDPGIGDELVRTGTYALTRHPGVLWFSLMTAFLIVATRSKLLLIAGPIWILMDIGWVWLQDRFYLEAMFPGYNDYKRETPMLVPTRESIKRCVGSLGRNRTLEGGGYGLTSRRDLAER